jgi:integrating conjugative element protein (TIGR03752 family)
MKSNALLKWLAIPLVLLVLFIVLRPTKEVAPTKASPTLTAEEARALGVEGDTARDTVATLVAQVKGLRGELKTALDENKQQKAENDRLREREVGFDAKVNKTLDAQKGMMDAERERLEADRKSFMAEIESRLASVPAQGSDLPVGLGLTEEDAQAFNRSKGKKVVDTPAPEVQWIEPAGKDASTKSGLKLSPGQKSLTADTAGKVSSLKKVVDPVTPVYTVPTNATLTGSIAMTALIGRVPVEGAVNDPYPFKVLIGPENLTANGIEIPEVAGMVASGTATGDWTLSCVRGEIRSITFVFQDGTIRTIPEDTKNRNSNKGDGLGWISDPYGIPCVSGERRSNAAQYLGTQSLITAAGAGAASLIKSDSGRVTVVSSSDAVGTVGISGNEAMGRILANGVNDMSQWVNKLYGQAFAAIYVQPGAKVALHLERPLTIDYDASGRRVVHGTGGQSETELD